MNSTSVDEQDHADVPESTSEPTRGEERAQGGGDTGESLTAIADEVEEPASRRRPWWTLSLVLSLVAVIGLLAAAAWLTVVWVGDSEQVDDQAAAVATARQAVVDLTTTDPVRAPQSFTELTELATGSFAQQLQNQSGVFVQAVQGAQVTSTGTVAEAGVVSASPARATVLVVANSVVKNVQVPTGEPRRYRMSLEMLKQGDRWLVSDLDFVA